MIPGLRHAVVCRADDAGALLWWWVWSGSTRDAPPEYQPLGPAAEIGDDPEIVELRVPAPFEVVGDVLRIGAIVVAEQLDPHRGRRLEGELGIKTGTVRKAGMEVD